MNSRLNISSATLSDIPDLCELLAILFAQEEEFMPDRDAQQSGLRLILDNPEVGTLLVAHLGDRVVGMVGLLYTVSTALGGRVALLEDMIVMPDSRGLGVGSQLLTHAIEIARGKGCKRITLLTDRSSLPAQKFYQRQGFIVSPMIPLRLLSDG